MKHNIAITVLAGTLAISGILFGSDDKTPGEFYPLKMNTLKIAAPSSLGRFNPLQAWRLLWPAKTTAQSVENPVIYDDSNSFEKEINDQITITAGCRDTDSYIHTAIEQNAQSKGFRLLLGALGYGLWRSYQALDHSLPLTRGVSKLLSTSSKYKLFGGIAALVLGAKYVAPKILGYWQKYDLTKTLNKHENYLKERLNTAYTGNIPTTVKKKFPTLFPAQS